MGYCGWFVGYTVTLSSLVPEVARSVKTMLYGREFRNVRVLSGQARVRFVER